MIPSLGNKWAEVRSEWQDLERHERIIAVWKSTNLVATVILPLLLLSVFITSAPRLPSVSTLLVLIGIGMIYGASVTFQGPIMGYIEPNKD